MIFYIFLIILYDENTVIINLHCMGKKTIIEIVIVIAAIIVAFLLFSGHKSSTTPMTTPVDNTPPTNVTTPHTQQGATEQASNPATMPATAPNTSAASPATSLQNIQGMTVTDLKVGTGPVAQNGDTVTVSYVGKLADGTVFDASANHGGTFNFTLGAGQVIKGWDLGVVGMRVGGERELVIPPALAYGSAGTPGGPIPANATLTFTVTLVSIAGK